MQRWFPGEPLIAWPHSDSTKPVRHSFTANSISMLAADGVTRVPASLAVFTVGDVGKLEYVRKYDVDVGSQSIFWMGIVG